jgi:2'-hydroxyisoflavone reductase
MGITRRDFLKSGAWLASALGLGACAPVSPMAGPGPEAPPRPEAAPRVEARKGPKKILILGGTGFLGPKLVEAAATRGHTLTLFNRGKTRPTLFPEIEKLRGDRDGDLKALEGRQWDAVIDTSGYVPRIVKASAELLAKSVDQYVFISSISVYGEDVKPGLDETAPVATIADITNEEVRKNYGALKALCEKAAEAAMPGRVTNIRPGLIVGPGDPTGRFTYWPLRLQRGGEVLAPGNGSDPAQIIDSRDLAAWTILMIEQGHAGIYNATGPEKRLTMAEMLAACKAASGSDATLTWVDAAFLAQQKVEGWTDLPVWVPPGPEAGMSEITITKALKHGLRFRPVEVTARDTLAWWKTLRDDLRTKFTSGLTAEREAAVLAEWKKRGAEKKSELRPPAAPRQARLARGPAPGIQPGSANPRQSPLFTIR